MAPRPKPTPGAARPVPAEIERFRSALIAWYRRGHRDLPWRRTRDPYAIWISEIMLQQTRVDTVKERFREFVARFPTVEALAAAPLEDVLTLWSGLGYYARARNLHAAAREVATRHGGRFPDDIAAVRALPGIGPYTAGAITSIAFGRSSAILDGNVIRVLSRQFAIDEPAEGTAKKRYWELSEALVPQEVAGSEKNDPGDFNQSLMELGATVCLPQNPVCLVCPIAGSCTARQQGAIENYPPKKAAKPVPVVRALTLVLSRNDGQVLLVRRPAAGLWGGLWEPPTLTLEENEEAPAGLLRLLRERLGLGVSLTASELQKLIKRAQPLSPFVHVLTHREMRFSPWQISWQNENEPALKLLGYEAARFIAPSEPLALGLASWVSSLLGRIALAAETSHAAY